MLNPPLNQLQSQINSKYLIATTAAKRARELDEKPETALLNGYHSAKPVGSTRRNCKRKNFTCCT